MEKRFLMVAAVCAASAAWAQQQPDEDVPGRAARLSYLSGTVSFQPGSVEDWVPATVNRPMTTGDRLWTEAGARAEMHLGSAALRLNGRTSFAFLNLNDRTTQVQVSVGSVSVRLRRLADDESFEIDTPQLALNLLRPGEYRVDVNEQGDTTVVGVRGGEAEVNAASQAVTLHPRDQLRATGVDQPVLDTRVIPPQDVFDNWCADRDRREDMSESGRHVSRDIPGYADLDGQGTWTETPDYGWVWAPRVTIVDWAPYHYGHWAWIAPWGWTWVDDAPWGYAPFHYGRWVFVGGGWGWVPGPIVARPVYAPALVAWVGGANWGVSIGIGVGPAVGWFPLGPREVWVPAYRYSPAYIERVNVTNTVIVNRTVFNNVNVTNVTYVNRNVTNAVTVMPQNAMVAGRPVAPAAVRVAPQLVARAQIQNTAAVAPERAAVLGARAQAAAPAPPAVAFNRQVVVRQQPPAPPPSFAQQQPLLRQNPGQPLTRGAAAQIPQPSAPGRGIGPAGGSQQPASQRPTFRQVGPPPAANTQVNPAPPTRTAPIQTTPQQPEFRRQPTPQATPQTTTPTPQPEVRRPAPQQPAPPPQNQPQPEYRRPPVQQQAPPQQTSPQPEVRRPAQPPSQPEPQVQRERGGPPQNAAPPRENPRQQQERQKGREKDDGKGHDRN